MAPIRDTGCQSLLNKGIEIVKLKLLGSVQKAITTFLKFL